jgi:hypothetical protein
VKVIAGWSAQTGAGALAAGAFAAGVFVVWAPAEINPADMISAAARGNRRPEPRHLNISRLIGRPLA